MIRETVVGIDSYLRDSGSDGCFSITLDRMIQNVLSCEVIEATIPYSLFQINGSCDEFIFGESSSATPITVIPELRHYTIPHGTYTYEGMIGVLNSLVPGNPFNPWDGGISIYNEDGAYNSSYIDLLQVGENPLKLAVILGLTDLANNTNWQLNRYYLDAEEPYTYSIPGRTIRVSCPEIFDGSRYADNVGNQGGGVICRIPALFSIEGVQHYIPQQAQIISFLFDKPRNLQTLRFAICAETDGVYAPIENGEIHISLRIIWERI